MKTAEQELNPATVVKASDEVIGMTTQNLLEPYLWTVPAYWTDWLDRPINPFSNNDEGVL